MHNASFLESLGATTVIDRKASDVGKEIANVTKDSHIDIVFDAISLEDTQNAGWDALAPNGTLVVLSPLTVDLAKYSNKKAVDDIQGNVHTPRLRALGISLYKALPELIGTGKLKVCHCAVFYAGPA